MTVGKNIANTEEKGTETNAKYFKARFSPLLVMVKAAGKERKCVRTTQLCFSDFIPIISYIMTSKVIQRISAYLGIDCNTSFSSSALA